MLERLICYFCISDDGLLVSALVAVLVCKDFLQGLIMQGLLDSLGMVAEY